MQATSTIDYSKYTEAELTEALAVINAEAFPDDYAALTKELGSRREEAESNIELVPEIEETYEISTFKKRLLVLMSLGGGFMGLTIAISTLLKSSAILAVIFSMVFVALFAFGIFAGFKLAEKVDHDALEAQKLFWLLQIPVVMSPIAGYQMASGFFLSVWLSSKTGLDGSISLGSNFIYSIFQSFQPWAIGVNFFALAMLIMVRNIQKTCK